MNKAPCATLLELTNCEKFDTSTQMNSGATNRYPKDKRAAMKSFSRKSESQPRYPCFDMGSDGGCGKMNERRTDDNKVHNASAAKNCGKSPRRNTGSPGDTRSRLTRTKLVETALFPTMYRSLYRQCTGRRRCSPQMQKVSTLDLDLLHITGTMVQMLY